MSLRDAGLLKVHTTDQGQVIDFAASAAWALVDHQFAQVLHPKRADERVAAEVRQLFTGRAGIAEVLVGAEREKYDLDHERSGEVILVSKPNSWMAYMVDGRRRSTEVRPHGRYPSQTGL